MAAKGRKGGRVIILLALLIILVVGGIYIYLQMQSPKTTENVPTAAPAQTMVDIVITTQSIPRGAEITEGTVMTIKYPEENLVQGTFITDIQSVLGARAKYDLDPGVPLTPAVLIQPSGGSVASFDVPKDFVAMSVPITRLTSVSNALAAGDHVMVVGCMMLVDIDPEFQTKLPNKAGSVTAPATNFETGEQTLTIGVNPPDSGSQQGRTEVDTTLDQPVYVLPSEPQRPRLVCQTVIQDAVVLRIGTYVEPVAAQPTLVPEAQTAEGEQLPTPMPTQSFPDLISLVVSPQDAVALNYMMLAGIKLNLALRNPTDNNPIVTDAVTQQYLMDQKNIPLPAKLPYALEPRIDGLIFPTTQPTPVPSQ
jgi:Flp pilus assembly protein CpaB